MHKIPETRSPRGVLWGIVTISVVYFATATFHPRWLGIADVTTQGKIDAEAHASKEGTEAPTAAEAPHFAAVAPFLLLLLAIAIFPLWRPTAHWWESNWNRLFVALALSGATLAHYALTAAHGGSHRVLHVLEHAILGEYIPFIVLLFSLYTIAGGIRIDANLRATSKTNAMFLALGGVLASFVGTTGAAMILVRPFLETNSERRYVQHSVVFFVFVVCNCGGCLLPIGDPPLFLGYLQGVEFLWTLQNLWMPWLVTNMTLISIYYVLDRFYFVRKERRLDARRDEVMTRRIQVRGLWPNAYLLIGVVLCVALLDPGKSIPGTAWHAWPFLREVVQLLLVAVSLTVGGIAIRKANRFNYYAILEVAALFVGIFICMQPAIEILHEKGGHLGIDTPIKFFWATGSLSAVLDNAPTYLVFFETAAANPKFADHPFHELVSTSPPFLELARKMLKGISLGAVFMGALTYIGNGPNFMVRAIAEQAGIRMPSFFGYVFRYSLPILLPIFAVVGWLFLV